MNDQEARAEEASKSEQKMLRVFQVALGGGATWNPWLHQLIRVKTREWGSRTEAARATRLSGPKGEG